MAAASTAPPSPDQHRALTALLARTQKLYDSSPLMYVLLDGEGTVMDGNRRALSGLSRRLGDLVGRPFEDLVKESSRPTLRAELAALSKEDRDETRTVELELATPAGDLFTSATLSVTRAADGTPVEIHVMMLDISEVRRLEQRMLQADRLASVGQLAAGVAHEINNPASWVITNLSYLQERLPLLRGRALSGPLLSGPPGPRGAARADEDAPGGEGEEEAASGRAVASFLLELPQLCSQSLDGMKRIRDIVRDLQLFAREPKAERERVELSALCDAVCNMAWPEIRRRARLEKSYAALPPVSVDAGRLSQVLLNLLINAAHAIPEGEQGRHKIVLSTGRRADPGGGEGDVFIAVRDTGCGIPKAVLSRIFDPFFTTKPPGKGTGLGLSVSYEIVRAHGGRIEVESEVGAGTTFTVLLPAATLRVACEEGAPAMAAALPPSPPEGSTGAGERPRGKVLVIDDEPELLRALQRTLKGRHEVLLASSGRDGIEQIRAHRDIDVVLCDVMMPETSGMDLYESLTPSVRDRFIFMSGDTVSAAVQAFLGSVRSPHLQKPVEPRELLDAVSQAVHRRRGAAPC